MVKLNGITWRKIGRLLDSNLVKEIVEKYKISTINAEDPFIPWKDNIAMISYGLCGGTHLYIKTQINRRYVAKYLSKRSNLRIRPDEVYYYALFHECGHIHDPDSPYNARAIMARPIFLNQIFPGTGELMTEEQLRIDKIKAERIADKFAINEFKKWRQMRRKKERGK